MLSAFDDLKVREYPHGPTHTAVTMRPARTDILNRMLY